MTRHLALAWGVQAVSFVVSLALIAVVLLRPVPGDADALNGWMRGAASLAAEELRAPGADPQAVYASLSERFGVPVAPADPDEILALQEGLLSVEWVEDSRRRLDREGFAVVPSSGGDFLYVGAEDRTVRFGPMPGFVWPSPGLMAGTLGVVALVWLVLSGLLAAPALRQTQALVRAAEAMAEGQLDTRLDSRAFPRLGKAFNAMADHVQALLRERRMTLASVSHEFRTPLARIRFAADLLADADADERSRIAEELDRDVEEIDALVEELLELGRLQGAPRARPEPLSVPDALGGLAGRATRVPVQWSLQEGEVRADRTLLVRAVRNLVDNAVRHASAGVWVDGVVQGASYALRVADDGPGIPPAERIRVLEPFVRLGSDGGRHGLGLAIVRDIAERHGGAVRVEESAQGGAAVVLLWPVSDTG